MSQTKAVNSPTSNPTARLKKDPSRHYVSIETDHKDYESPLFDYLNKPSPTDPEKFMYEQDSDDPTMTGHRRKVIISCSKEDYEAYEAANNRDANGIDPKATEGSDTTAFDDGRGGVFKS